MNEGNERPTDRASWDQRYREGEPPWDSGKPGVHLPAVLAQHGVEPGRAPEIGCGACYPDEAVR